MSFCELIHDTYIVEYIINSFMTIIDSRLMFKVNISEF